MDNAFQEHQGVWILAEQRGGNLSEVSLELLGIGQRIAHKANDELAAVLMGHKVESLVSQLVEYGAKKVYVTDDPLLEVYRSDAYAILMQRLIAQYKPSILLIGATNIGADLAPRVAAKVDTGLSAHCIAFDLDDRGQLVGQVPGFGGSVVASVICPNHRPQMATVRPGFFPRPQRQIGAKADIIRVPIELSPEDLRIKVVAVSEEEENEATSIGSADSLVVGGYGVGSKENWELVEELARALGAQVGATRPACDEGWANLESQMIGQSGRVVRPKLYVGVGISGAIHHTIGIKDSRVIVAINKNPEAPIFQIADYGIVGDLCQVVPCLIAEIRKTETRSPSIESGS